MCILIYIDNSKPSLVFSLRSISRYVFCIDNILRPPPPPPSPELPPKSISWGHRNVVDDHDHDFELIPVSSARNIHPSHLLEAKRFSENGSMDEQRKEGDQQLLSPTTQTHQKLWTRILQIQEISYIQRTYFISKLR